MDRQEPVKWIQWNGCNSTVKHGHARARKINSMERM